MKPKRKKSPPAARIHQHREMSIRGWFSPRNKEWYRRRVSQIHNGEIAEVGVYGGASILSIVDICIQNGIIIHGIDPWEKISTFNGKKVPLDEKKKKQRSLKQRRKHLADVIEKYNYGDTIKLIQGFSTKVADRFVDNSLDLVFIDGDHSYDAVSNDLRAWWPKVKQGCGVMGGHDYSGPASNITQAVDEFVKLHKLEAQFACFGNIWDITKT